MEKIPFQHSLASKLLVAILALPAVLTVVGFFIFHEIEQRRLTAFSQLKVRHISDVNTDLLVNSLDVFREKVMRLASDNQIIVPYKLNVRFQLSKHLEHLLNQNELKTITIISVKGKIVTSAGERISDYKLDLDRLAQDVLQNESRSFYTARYDSELGQRLAMAAYAPILSGTHVIAYLIIGGDVVLKEVFSDTVLISNGKVQSQSTELPYLKPLLEKIDSTSQYGLHTFAGHPVLISKIPIPGYADPSSYLVSAIDLHEDFLNNRRIVVTGLLISGCILILLAVYAVYLSKRLTDPLFDIVQVADRVIAKNDHVEWLPERKDEIGALNKSLQLMTQTLQKTITDLKIAKKQAEEGYQAKLANEAKSEFLANMSHELRTPLNHIIGFTQLVVDKNFGDLNEAQEEYLRDVLDSGQHLLELINDILDLSKVEAGRLELQPRKVNLNELLENSLTMIKEKALKHRIKVLFSTNGIPDTITADERKLKQIIYNLLSNAVKFTRDGGQISMTAQACQLEDEAFCKGNSHTGPGIKVTVSDTGIGIHPKDLDRIFNPFEQVENSRSRKFQGTGLGLSLTKNLVELHGGKIRAESAGEGQGATFICCIPV